MGNTAKTQDSWISPAAFSGQIYSQGWQEPGGGVLQVFDKAGGELLGEVGQADSEDVARAAQSAAVAQREWAATELAERIEVLQRAASILDSNREEIAQWVIREAGAAVMLAAASVQTSIDELKQVADLAGLPMREVLAPGVPGERSVAERVPLGVVGVINPWNNPLFFAWRALAPVLALGNAALLKPDANTPVTGGMLPALILEEAGLPSGLLHVLPGGQETGEAIVAEPRVAMISFTGSSAAGKAISAAAGLKRTQLELGGNNAFIVLDDADVEQAASAGAFSSFLHQGQGCICAGRHLVHRDVLEAYATALVDRAEALTLGDPRDPEVQLGPVINDRQASRIEQLVNTSIEAGARTLTGARRDGTFYTPTVLDSVEIDMPVYTEEIFGPVAPIVPFSTEAEVIDLANGTTYGLTAAVHSRSTDRAERVASQLATGMVHINDVTIRDAADAPFGGLGASGDGTRFGGFANVEAFTQWRWTTVSEQQPALPF